MYTPKIKFEFDQKLDTEMLWEFLGDAKKGGFDFSAEVIKNHPALKNNTSKEVVKKYVANYYRKHEKELRDAKKDIEKRWKTVESEFYKATDKYFEKLSWPKGKYIGYISINPCGPRFLPNKTWQTPYFWPKEAIGQIIHEMLHFLFFEQATKVKNTHFKKDQLWHLSEIFNDIIQKEKEFVQIQGYIPEISYPDHNRLHKKYLLIWKKNKTARKFIENSTAEIKKDF
ncbi:MAG: hypothetical protein PHW75_01430 [Patescibacteria group bacterium]|nr:hypothetical protein [Patescibacteria group bacterium]